MRLSDGTLKKIRWLLDGKPIAASSLKGDWVETLVGECVLVKIFQGSKGQYRISDRKAFLSALSDLDERLRSADFIAGNLESLASDRSGQAADTGNSKIVKCRSCPGFPASSYEPIVCSLDGREFILSPTPGTFVFICEWWDFHIPEDVTVVGMENMENFRMIQHQRPFLETLTGGGPLLFVSRFPQSKDLRNWLRGIPNRYIHFGDFDLAGIRIYETEFAVHLRERPVGPDSCSMLIPGDIEERLRDGNRERYTTQLAECGSITSPDPEINRLLSLIHKYRRGYDQEGYILRHPKNLQYENT